MTSLLDIAAGIEADAAEPYLRARGWELVQEGDLGNRWRLRVEDRVRNVAVPRSVLDLVDQTRMLATVLQVLGEVEQRDPFAIARDVKEAAFDLLEFRLIADSLTRGEMPLKAAPELTSGAYEAVQAAARAAVDPRPHYRQGAIPALVRSFIDGTVLAGTERGSVVLRVRAPAPDVPLQTTLDGLEDSESFERRVINSLLDGLRAAKLATHRDPTSTDLDSLDEYVDSGLSANLCDALLKLSGVETRLDAQVAVRIRWALTRPSSEPSSEVVIDHREMRHLDRIAEILKETEPVPDTTVVGPVTSVRRDLGDPTGIAYLDAEIDGRVRKVRIALERSDYELALTAHRAERELRATGTLERTGTTRELTAPTNVAIQSA